MCQYIDGMERQSSKRRWTAVEDAKLRQRASVGWPTLRALAVDCGRSYYATRHRASRLGAIRLERSDPAERAARGPTEIPCRYCGGAFLSRGSLRYCGPGSAGPWPVGSALAAGARSGKTGGARVVPLTGSGQTGRAGLPPRPGRSKPTSWLRPAPACGRHPTPRPIP